MVRQSSGISRFFANLTLRTSYLFRNEIAIIRNVFLHKCQFSRKILTFEFWLNCHGIMISHDFIKFMKLFALKNSAEIFSNLEQMRENNKKLIAIAIYCIGLTFAIKMQSFCNRNQICNPIQYKINRNQITSQPNAIQYKINQKCNPICNMQSNLQSNQRFFDPCPTC